MDRRRIGNRTTAGSDLPGRPRHPRDPVPGPTKQRHESHTNHPARPRNKHAHERCPLPTQETRNDRPHATRSAIDARARLQSNQAASRRGRSPHALNDPTPADAAPTGEEPCAAQVVAAEHLWLPNRDSRSPISRGIHAGDVPGPDLLVAAAQPQKQLHDRQWVDVLSEVVASARRACRRIAVSQLRRMASLAGRITSQ